MRPRIMLGVIVSLIVLLAACAPAAVPPAKPEFYTGSKDNVFATIVKAMSTSPALKFNDLEYSNGWTIAQSDSAGGFVRAETTVHGWANTVRTEAVSVVVTADGDGQCQVIIQATGGAKPLAMRVRKALAARFGAPSSG